MEKNEEIHTKYLEYEQEIYKFKNPKSMLLDFRFPLSIKDDDEVIPHVKKLKKSYKITTLLKN
jgi:hypothetical protein